MDHEMEFDRAYRQYAGLIYRYFSYTFHELYTIGSTTPIVTRLLQQDGTIYGFYYETGRDTPGRGELNGIWDTVK